MFQLPLQGALYFNLNRVFYNHKTKVGQSCGCHSNFGYKPRIFFTR